MPPESAGPGTCGVPTTQDLLGAIVDLPLPAKGATAERWEHLRDLGRRDLPLAKLVEPHHDATAILADLAGTAPGPGEVWAVWAAEPPGSGLRAARDGTGWRLDGSKPFCSGAVLVTHALVTATADDGPRLFAVDVAAARDTGPGLVVEPPSWVGGGMARADTRTVALTGVPAVPVGAPGGYTDRAGFWHGAVGVAACWAGGLRGVAARLLDGARRRPPDPLTAAHLGAVAVAVDSADSALAVAAEDADAGRLADVLAARRRAESVRASVVAAAEDVVSRVGRALGPGPLAYDAEHAGRVADLQVFVRQHHADKDLAALGDLVAAGGEAW